MRLAPILLLAATTLTAQQYDLILKGGHVIDPKTRVDGVRDVAISAGRIARVAESIDGSQCRQVVDVSGLYVTPGLLDIHVHIYPRLPQTLAPGRNLGVDPDAFSFRTGVTTVVDAGSTGWREFPDFRSRVIDRARTCVLALLNIAC